jgi:hypothetical protein
MYFIPTSYIEHLYYVSLRVREAVKTSQHIIQPIIRAAIKNLYFVRAARQSLIIYTIEYLLRSAS